ncbi:hypothetical protein PHLCEN_2v176 [Hermanssonia centrifuga]|uniref:Uncharacterized protein n=1 Tax=Hermanssonia centrifuga TaxID=98765 RepID=A0A2R6S6W3_9APHY|nr:hypothetical protein PHLCEN_2v176 [Hermanssonia centrifuga]
MPVLRSGTCTARNVSALPVAPGRARKVSRRKIKKPKRARKRKPDIQWSTPWMGSLPMTRYESKEKRKRLLANLSSPKSKKSFEGVSQVAMSRSMAAWLKNSAPLKRKKRFICDMR